MKVQREPLILKNHLEKIEMHEKKKEEKKQKMDALGLSFNFQGNNHFKPNSPGAPEPEISINDQQEAINEQLGMSPIYFDDPLNQLSDHENDLEDLGLGYMHGNAHANGHD
jgi:hypothetical protein